MATYLRMEGTLVPFGRVLGERVKKYCMLRLLPDRQCYGVLSDSGLSKRRYLY